MKITELRVANFRCFKKATLRIAPVTLITGANSAGKSSLVAPLLALSQTDGMPALLSPNGRHVDMGGFKEMVHGRGKEGIIGVGFDADSSADVDSHFVVDGRYGEDLTSSGLRLRELDITGNYFAVRVASADDGYRLTYEIRPRDSRMLREFSDRRKSGKHENSQNFVVQAKTIEELVDKLRFLPDADSTDSRWRESIDNQELLEGKIGLSEPHDLFSTMFSDPVLAKSFVAGHFTDLTRQMQNDLAFVSSFRLAPQRTYYEIAKADLKVGRHGENYVEQIAQWTSTDTIEIAGLREDLAALGVLSDLKIGRLGAGRMELRGKPKRKSPLTNLADLGFGTSQLLPVLVAINQMEPGGTFVVAQPETHLHPEAQARLANYFVRLAKEREITFIVETHSEYLINRLRLLVADGEVREDQVSVAHVTNSGKESQVHPIQLRADGQILGAPEDFFKTYMVDVMQLAMGS